MLSGKQANTELEIESDSISREPNGLGMQVLHLIPHLSAEASGPSYSVPRLCQGLAERGNDVSLACMAARAKVENVRLEVLERSCLFGGLDVSPAFAMAAWSAAKQRDIIHNHSLWSPVNIMAGLVVPGKKALLVTSPRGTLSTWALSLSRRRKRLVWPLQRLALEHAGLLHATSEGEYHDIRRNGFRNPVAVIPNGIDIPKLLPREKASEEFTVLLMARLHPTKGIENLIDAWTGVEAKHRNWKLRIVGPGEPSYVAGLKMRVRKRNLRRVVFAGPLYGQSKQQAYRNADLFVLPSYSENFGVVVAEALANECPVIVGRGAPWAELDRRRCGWWVDNDPRTLSDALNLAMSYPLDDLRAMGRRGRKWMEREYSWALVAQRMEAAYSWVLGDRSKLDWVRVD